MKILDHEGRLFGKLNLFDAIILATLLFLISMIPFWFHAPKKIENVEPKYVYKTVHLRASVYKNTCGLIKPGHADVNLNNGMKDAEILSIIDIKPERLRPEQYILIDGKECPIFKYGKKIVILRMKILCFQHSNQIIINKDKRTFKINAFYPFAHQGYGIDGRIIKIEKEE